MKPFSISFSLADFPGNSGDSMCSSDVSLDGSNFDNFDEATSDTMSLQNLDVQPNGPNNNGLETNNNGPVTHIDKLYLMQNSYFSAIEQ
jgi:LIM homeobox transcription factor 1